MADLIHTTNSVTRRYKDLGDGTFAEVVYAVTSASTPESDIVITTNSVTKRYRNMGDGTFAEVLIT